MKPYFFTRLDLKAIRDILSKVNKGMFEAY
jgi:hypothetical protein